MNYSESHVPSADETSGEEIVSRTRTPASQLRILTSANSELVCIRVGFLPSSPTCDSRQNDCGGPQPVLGELPVPPSPGYVIASGILEASIDQSTISHTLAPFP